MSKRKIRLSLAGIAAGSLFVALLVGSQGASATPSGPLAAFPGNPISKPGFYLTASDEFNSAGETVTPDLWNSRYLQHWTPVDTSARYTIADGNINLRIDQDTAPWDPTNDGDTRISSIQTAEKNWLHNWAGQSSIPNPQSTKLQLVQKYGYFEIRAKVQKGGGIHSAWWMVGAQQDSTNGSTEQNAEIDIFETLGRNPNEAKMNLYPWGDPNVTGDTGFVQANMDLSEDFHVYGFEWSSTQLKFYIDNELVKTIEGSPNYPMLTLLGIYEKRVNGWTGPFDSSVPYPKEFSIDYFRAYQKIPTLPYTFQAEDAALYGNATSGPVAGASNGRTIKNLGQGSDNVAVYDNLYAPDSGNRELEIRYASGEARDMTYQVNGGEQVTILLPSSGGWDTFGTHTVTAGLNTGENQIRLWNATGWAADIDSIRVQ